MPRLTQIMVLYCGQGMTTLVEIYDNGDPTGAPDFLALIDCGGDVTEGDEATTYIANKVSAKADKELDTIFISHQDGDHHLLLDQLGGKLRALDCTVAQIAVNGRKWGKSNVRRVEKFAEDMDVSMDDIKTNQPYESDYEDVTKYADLGYQIHHGDVYIRSLVSGLAVSGAPGVIKNSSTAVFVVENGTYSVILPGDATYQTMRAVNVILAKRNLIPGVVALEIPHHGAIASAVEKYRSGYAPSSFNWDVITTFAGNFGAPKIAVSAGPDNTYNHPVQEVLQVFAGPLRDVTAHRYRAYVYTAAPNSLYSQGWENYAGILKAVYATVEEWTVNTYDYDDIQIRLSALGVLREEEMVVKVPRARPGARAAEPIHYAPAP